MDKSPFREKIGEGGGCVCWGLESVGTEDELFDNHRIWRKGMGKAEDETHKWQYKAVDDGVGNRLQISNIQRQQV